MCDCIAKLNGQLAIHPQGSNTRIVSQTIVNIDTGRARILPKIQTEKRLSKGRKCILIIPAYCPFCGKSFNKERKSRQGETQ